MYLLSEYNPSQSAMTQEWINNSPSLPNVQHGRHLHFEDIGTNVARVCVQAVKNALEMRKDQR
jgi:hypothetical protein